MHMRILIGCATSCQMTTYVGCVLQVSTFEDAYFKAMGKGTGVNYAYSRCTSGFMGCSRREHSLFLHSDDGSCSMRCTWISSDADYVDIGAEHS